MPPNAGRRSRSGKASRSEDKAQAVREKIGVGRLTTNEEQGRKGIVSMSSQAKAARKGAVAERKSAKMSRIAGKAV
jgi:metal-responsive CopG/Arc/MetJ family transcriptional regulator